MTSLEIAANGITTISIFLAGRGSVHTWWTGIIGSILFGWLFYNNQLLADVTLQAFFIMTSITGWVNWNSAKDKPALAITQSAPKQFVIYAVAGLCVALAYGAILHRFTNAYAPFWDSTILVASVIAQLLLVRRKLETWMFWLVVNTIAVPLYFSRDLSLTGGLYAAYWVNAIVSWFLWRKKMMKGAS